jgi:hypothetical protein
MPPDPPDHPSYRTPVPSCGTADCNIFYSEAPLEGVTRVQLCHDSDGCIGLLLDYEKHSQIVGEFRYDKGVSRYFQRPQSISLSHEQHLSTRCIDVKFSSQSTCLDTAFESGMQPMRGTIVWWYSIKMGNVSSTRMCNVSIVT